MTTNRLLVLVALFLSAVYNVAFFRNVLGSYPLSSANLPFLLTLAALLPSVTFLLLSALCNRFTTKPVLILIFLLSAPVAYFMDSYNVVIDRNMIQNILDTDAGEAFELVTPALLAYVLVLGVIPSVCVALLQIRRGPFVREVVSRLTGVAVAVLVIFAVVFSQSARYASFFTHNKILRHYANPAFYIYSVYSYVERNVVPPPPLRPIGEDAHQVKSGIGRRLVIFVVGESASASHFAFNGYHRDTNPLLATEDIVNFPKMYACGTSTNIAVPCMFSLLGRNEFTRRRAAAVYNVLDVLNVASVNVLWRENNSSSQGVAERVPYESFLTAETNPVCDVECRATGMLFGLDRYVEGKPDGDFLIVLHPRGSHGPAYFRRYPKEFERFVPACHSPQIESCSAQEIVNAYDNTILYTDYFLGEVIRFLKAWSGQFETAMIYVSDHGESLGEGGIYFHSMPYFMAPEEQRRVPALMWFGKGLRERMDIERLRIRAAAESHHDMLAHTLLGLLEVRTSVYVRERDLLNGIWSTATDGGDTDNVARPKRSPMPAGPP